MTSEPADELAYLRRSLDEIGAENVSLTARVMGLRSELEVRRRGFSLLARVGRTLRAHLELEPALASVLPVVEAELRVQRVVALRREGDGWTSFAWTGFGAGDAVDLEGRRLALPQEGVVVRATTRSQPWMGEVCEALGVVAFVAAPVGPGDHLLLVGRLQELTAFFPTFEDADADTLAAVADLVAASVENARLAALSEARRFLSPALVEQLARGGLRSDEGYERREVTLLAVDMVGSTPLAERLAPDALADLLNAYLREMTTLAHAHGGTVGSMAGDGLLLIFGAPASMPPAQQASAAARAAFAMLSRMDALAAELGEEVRIRIGLNTGVASVGIFGSDIQRTYTALGLPVHLTARLEAAAAPGEVLASKATLDLLGEQVVGTEREPLVLKGFTAPVPAYALRPR